MNKKKIKRKKIRWKKKIKSQRKKGMKDRTKLKMLKTMKM